MTRINLSTLALFVLVAACDNETVLPTFHYLDCPTCEPFDFGAVPVGETSCLTRGLVNKGTRTISVAEYRMTAGGTSFSVTSTSAVVMVQENAMFTVCFRPEIDGRHEGQLEIHNDSTNDAVLRVALSGFGRAVEKIDGGVTLIDGGVTTIDGGTIYVDGGTRTIDGGVAVTDGGTVRIDGGVEHIDGGTVRIDGGVAYVDGGVDRIDGGVVAVDGGVATIDGGVDVIDGGVQSIDGGVTTIDGGIDVIDGGVAINDGGTETIDGGIHYIDGGMPEPLCEPGPAVRQALNNDVRLTEAQPIRMLQAGRYITRFVKACDDTELRVDLSEDTFTLRLGRTGGAATVTLTTLVAASTSTITHICQPLVGPPQYTINSSRDIVRNNLDFEVTCRNLPAGLYTIGIMAEIEQVNPTSPSSLGVEFFGGTGTNQFFEVEEL